MKRTGRIVGLIMGCVLLTSFSSFGQDLVSERAERRSLVGCPTAFALPRASFDFDIHTFPNGGVQGAVHIGLLDQFMIGLSYGAEELLGETEANGNPRMEVSVKLRLLSEGLSWPGLAIGYDSQGFGAWDDEWDRYSQKAKGFYAVFSKSFLFSGKLTTWHLGVNYTPEGKHQDDDPTVFLGFDANILDRFALLGEYDLAMNDNDHPDGYPYGSGHGYLNIGFEWVIIPTISVELDVRDLLVNKEAATAPDREVRLLVLQYL
ncbi:MAG: hypothetical protein ACE5JC_03970 [Candidatus Zixiibacteriota bacterium]